MAQLSATNTGMNLIQGFKNWLINGNFDFWQRATSQTDSSYGSDDRWYNANIGTTKTNSRQTFTVGQTDVPNNPRYYSRTVVTSSAGATNYCLKYQKIESVRSLSGKTATLSFWAKADASKNIAVELKQEFGTGGSPSTDVTGIGVTTCALTTTWQKFIVTVDIPSISGATLGTDGNDGLRINFWFEAGSNFDSRTNSLGQQSGTFDIDQIQLEEGGVATEFENRPIGLEFSLCLRYFWKATLGSYSFRGYKSAVTNGDTSQTIQHPVPMRDIPSVTYTTEVNDTPTAPTSVQTTADQSTFIYNGGGTLNTADLTAYQADAEL